MEQRLKKILCNLQHIFASQGLRFGSPFSPPLADLEYILRIHALIFHWLRYTHVGELKMAAPSEEKHICDKFNLEALTVIQVKIFKALADGKDVFIGTKTGQIDF
jgi:hypothetical protein